MKGTASVVLKYHGVDVAKSSLVCAAIADLSEHRRHYLPGQARDLGLVDDEPVQSRTFSNSVHLTMNGFLRSLTHPMWPAFPIRAVRHAPPPSEMVELKKRLTQSKRGKPLLLTVYEGVSTYTVTLPMPYAIRFFTKNLLSSLEMLNECEEAKART